MTEFASAYVSIIPTLKGAQEAIAKELDAPAEKAGRSGGKKLGQGLTKELKAQIAGTAFGQVLGQGIVGGARAAVGGLKSLVDGAREAARTTRLTEQVIKTTGGAANITAGQVGELATAISNKTGIDDEAIQTGANLLLTFTNVRNEVGKGNDIFNQATGLVADFSASLGQDAKSSAIQLGKALNDPIKGVSALSDVGVSFTEQQKQQIKTLVESGDVLGAQKVILSELGKEFGGAAEAAADPSAKLTVTLDNLREQVGTALLPVFNAVTQVLVSDVVPAVSSLIGFVQKNSDVIGPLAAVLGTVAGILFTLVKVTQAYTAVSAALTVVLNANPIGLVVIAVAALVTGLILAYKNSETFRRIVGNALDFVKNAASTVFNFFKSNWPLLLGILTGPFGLALGFIIKNRDRIIDVIKAIPGLVKRAMSGAFDAIVGAFKSAVNSVIDLINGLEFKTPKVEVFGKTLIDSQTIGFPDIPRLARGGAFEADRPVIVGENGPEAILPSGSGTVLTANQTRGLLEVPDGIGSGRSVDQQVNILGTNAVIEQALAENSRQLIFALSGAAA